jgi:hypothetical protein
MADLGPHLDSVRHCHFLLSGQRTATVTIPLLSAPWACQLANPKANARVSGGTTPTLTVDLKEVSTSLLSAPMTVDATPVEVAGTPVADPSIASGAMINCTLTIGGTNPTWDDVSVTFDLLRTA